MLLHLQELLSRLYLVHGLNAQIAKALPFTVPLVNSFLVCSLGHWKRGVRIYAGEVFDYR